MIFAPPPVVMTSKQKQKKKKAWVCRYLSLLLALALAHFSYY